MEKLVANIEENGLLSSSDGEYVTDIQQNTGETLVLSLTDADEGTAYVVMISKERHEGIV